MRYRSIANFHECFKPDIW